MRISDWSSDVCSSDLARPTPSSSPDRRRSPTMPSVGEIRIVAGERLGIFAGLLSKLLLRELFVACLFEIIVIAAGLRAIVGDLLDLFVDALALAFPAGSAFAGDRKSTRLNSSH